MLQYLLKNSNFSVLRKLLTPELLRAIPPGPALQFVGTLIKNQKRLEVYESLLQTLSTDLNRTNLRYTIATSSNSSSNSLGVLNRSVGQEVLELYFFQIQTRNSWILDFRTLTFKKSTDLKAPLQWYPKPLFYELDFTFAQGVSELYEGHYLENENKFNQGLNRLGILSVREVVRRHFGSGDLSSYQFKLESFQSTFVDLIRSCSENGIRLDVQFLSLGVMLLGLYQTLEGIGESFDVRASYRNALQASQNFRRMG
jgi:hypothetical protein